jgi:hypothetical protein
MLAEINTAIDGGTVFSDIFESADPSEEGTCPEGFTSINAGHEGGKHQCLTVKEGMEVVASRLETRRYAALMGATTELRKEEGITFDADNGKLYSAMSEVAYGSETTSPYWYPNINNWAYLMGVIQHPYGESDEDKLTDESDAAAYVGYTGPIPAMD